MYFYRKKHIYEGGPLVVHASHSRWEFSEPICISVPGGVVRGCVQLWWIFFENFQRVCPFHYGWFISTPALLSVQQFMTQNVITPLTPPFQSPDPAPSDFFSCCFPGWEKKKALKGKRCADVENVKQKTTEVLKGITIDKFKKLFWAVEETSPHQVYCINWSILWRSLNFKHARINTQFFINKCGSFGVPPYILYHSFCF